MRGTAGVWDGSGLSLRPSRGHCAVRPRGGVQGFAGTVSPCPTSALLKMESPGHLWLLEWSQIKSGVSVPDSHTAGTVPWAAWSGRCRRMVMPLGAARVGVLVSPFCLLTVVTGEGKERCGGGSHPRVRSCCSEPASTARVPTCPSSSRSA